jgi:hypothetical protein
VLLTSSGQNIFIIKMEAAGSSETIVLPYQATTCYILKDQTNFTTGIFQSYFSHTSASNLHEIGKLNWELLGNL